MQPSSWRRVHGAEFKAQVMAECQQAGASVAAVAMAHGLNVNLVRKWLVGRGLKRASLVAPRTARSLQPHAGPAAMPASPLQFLPVELPTPSKAAADAEPAPACIDIELHRAARALACRAGR